MKIEQAKQIIRNELQKYGVKTEERQSSSTSSFYFTIYGLRDAQLHFRVSDHPSHKNIITLRVDHKQNDNLVRSFVKNRIRDLNKRALNAFFASR